MQGKRGLFFAVMLSAAGLAGCDQQPSATSAAVSDVDAQSATPSAASIAQDLASGDYDKAAKAAEKAVAANPADPELHLLQARAQARLQNVGAAVGALQAAFNAGFHDPRGALNNPDFDGIRANGIFAQFAAKYQRKQSPGAAKPRSAPASSITAGDVSIIESADGSSRIRAGDVVIED